jgi:glycine/D-amino acid oxidase-like deaminating enzyme
MRRKDHNDMKPTISRYHGTISARELCKALVRAAILGAVLLPSVSVALAQVYGVAKKTTVVSTPHGTAAVSKTTVVGAGGTASKTTVVTTGGALPHGYIAVMPGGYRAVTVSGVRYYTVGGIYYRPQIYQGRTVYVVVRL